MSKYNEKRIELEGNEITYYPIGNDVNGNPRCVVHFRDLDIELNDYGRVPGLTKYRGKWFGGGYVTQCWNAKEDIGYMLKTAKEYYSKKKN